MATVIIIVINVLIFFYSQTRPRLIDNYLLSEDRIRRHNEWYRLITSGFLHGSPGHLLFNMYSLYSFGTHLESEAGVVFLISVFFASILFGGLFSLYLHWGNWDYRALGASGGVTGVICACVLLFNSSVGLIFVPVYIPGYVFAILFFVASFLFGTKKIGNTAHDAHVGGALAGCLFAAIFFGSIFDTKSILLYVFSGVAISIWIWHEKNIKDTIIFLTIFICATVVIALSQNWNTSMFVKETNPSLSYYQNASITEGERKIFGNYIDDQQYLLLLKYSLSLSKEVKIDAVNKFPTLTTEIKDEFKKTIQEEAKEFVDFKEENFTEIKTIILKQQNEWGEIVSCAQQKKLPACE